MAQENTQKVAHSCENAHLSFTKVCLEVLRESGARVTQPRRAVISCLGKADKPLSAREVYEEISCDSSVSSVDQVSVYRILETLSELELVHQIFPSGKYIPCLHSNCDNIVHVIVRCTSCEAINELNIPQETFAPMQAYLQTKYDFFLDQQVFQVNGLCASCKKNS